MIKRSKAKPEDGQSTEVLREEGARSGAPLQQLRGMALWKQGLLVVSVLCMACGVALSFTGPKNQVASSTPAPPTESAPTDPGGATDPPTGVNSPVHEGGGDAAGATPSQSLLPTDDGATPPASTGTPTQDGAQVEGPVLSPALFRVGFGFFVGFAIAFALRAFIKISLAIIGLYLLFFLGLEYAGLIEVRWNIVSDRYDGVMAWLGAEFESFRAFVTGRIPAAGSALAGTWIGFTRK